MSESKQYPLNLALPPGPRIFASDTQGNLYFANLEGSVDLVSPGVSQKIVKLSLSTRKVVAEYFLPSGEVCSQLAATTQAVICSRTRFSEPGGGSKNDIVTFDSSLSRILKIDAISYSTKFEAFLPQLVQSDGLFSLTLGEDLGRGLVSSKRSFYMDVASGKIRFVPELDQPLGPGQLPKKTFLGDVTGARDAKASVYLIEAKQHDCRPPSRTCRARFLILKEDSYEFVEAPPELYDGRLHKIIGLVAPNTSDIRVFVWLKEKSASQGLSHAIQEYSLNSGRFRALLRFSDYQGQGVSVTVSDIVYVTAKKRFVIARTQANLSDAPDRSESMTFITSMSEFGEMIGGTFVFDVNMPQMMAEPSGQSIALLSKFDGGSGRIKDTVTVFSPESGRRQTFTSFPDLFLIDEFGAPHRFPSIFLQPGRMLIPEWSREHDLGSLYLYDFSI